MDNKERESEEGTPLLKANEAQLEEIIVELERELRKFLKERLPPRSDFDILLKLSKGEQGVDLVVEIETRGVYGNEKLYRDAIDDAVNYARKFFEERRANKPRGALS